MDLPTVVSITALVLAVAAVVIALQFQYHGLSRVVDKTVYKVDTLTAQATTLVGNSAGILAEVKELRSVWQLRPDVPLLLATRGNEGHFPIFRSEACQEARREAGPRYEVLPGRRAGGCPAVSASRAP